MRLYVPPKTSCPATRIKGSHLKPPPPPNDTNILQKRKPKFLSTYYNAVHGPLNLYSQWVKHCNTRVDTYKALWVTIHHFWVTVLRKDNVQHQAPFSYFSLPHSLPFSAPMKRNSAYHRQYLSNTYTWSPMVNTCITYINSRKPAFCHSVWFFFVSSAILQLNTNYFPKLQLLVLFGLGNGGVTSLWGRNWLALVIYKVASLRCVNSTDFSYRYTIIRKTHYNT